MHVSKTQERRCLLLLALSSPFLLANIFEFIAPFRSETQIHGFVNESFLHVYDTFKHNFDAGLERDGASVAIYHRGDKVLHLWGGYADRTANIKWKANTRAIYFSATKAISSLCIAVLVDRGLLRYDDYVAKYWPEYGQNGKNTTTIEDVLTHKAGLPYLDTVIEIEDVENPRRWMKIIERATPIWKPGYYSGYHPVTFGFLVDGIMRKVDGRSMKLFFEQEIARPHGLNMRIGNSPSESHLVARITQPSLFEYIYSAMKDPRILAMLSILYRPFDDTINRIRTNPSWLVMDFDKVALNDPQIMKLNMPAVTGVGTADAFAKLFSLALDGTLLSSSTVRQMLKPTLDEWYYDRTVVWPIAKGKGFFYEKHPVISDAFVFGHPGFGGQQILVDPHTQTTLVYVSNGLKTGSGELCHTYMRLMRAMYRILPAPAN